MLGHARTALCAFLLLASCVLPLAAQAPPRARHAVSAWSTGHGLPQNTITGLAEDPDGYLWVGMLGRVARFDGQRFLEFGLSEAAPLGTDPVRAMATDRAGNVWVVRYHGGLGRIAPDGSVVPGTSPLPEPPQGVAFGGGDSVWLAGTSRVWLHTGGRWRDAVEGLRLGGIHALEVDARGRAWIGAREGLWRIATGGVARWTTEEGLPGRDVLAMAPSAEGLWVGTDRGLALIDGDDRVWRVTGYRDDAGPVEAIATASPHQAWVAGPSGVRLLGLERRATHVAASVTAAFPDVRDASALLVDRGGRVWIGTEGSGLRQVRPLTFARITRQDGLPKQPVHAVLGDGAGGLWIAGGCGGLSHWQRGTIEVFHPPALGLRAACIDGLARDRAGRLWLGQHGRLTRWDWTGRAHQYDLGAGQQDGVGPLFEARDGAMWAATVNGPLARIHPDGRFEYPVHIPGLDTTRVWSFAEDEAGHLWVGQVGAASQLRGDSVHLRLGASDGVPGGALRALAARPGGGLWLAAYGGGLAWFHPSSGVSRLGAATGLFDDNLSAIIIDSAGRVWLLGDAGLAVAPEADLLHAVRSGQPLREAVVFGPADSMPEGNGGFPNAWIDPQQRLWLATVDGVASVDATGYPFDRPPPRARIDQLVMNGTPVPRTDSLVVPPGGAAFSFAFSAPELDGTGRLRFRYRLVGHDRDWIQTSDRVARYARVPPGGYRFEVLARSTSGVENPEVATAGVQVRAEWWESTWVQALALLLVLAAMWRWQQGIVRRVRQRNQVLQDEVAERKRAQEEASRAARELAHVSRVATAGELATSIAHEINQPLSAVMSNAQAARQALRIGADDELLPALEEIVQQSERAADVIRTLRAFVGKQAPEARTLETRGLVREAIVLAQPELAVRGVTIQVDLASDVPVVHGDPVQLQQVLINLLLNAASAVRQLPDERRVVTVRSARRPGGVALMVEDHGHGMTPDVLARAQEPFYTTRPDGLGLGLSLSRSILESHGGSLTIESNAGRGTTVFVHLPHGGAT